MFKSVDHAVPLGPARPASSYLDAGGVMAAAWPPGPRPSIPATVSWPRTPPSRPGVIEAGLIWVGPPPDAIRQMGNKIT